MTKRIVLCADDYGQAPEVSQGIITLGKYGRLSATSCLVNSEYWLEHAKWLIPLKPQLELGLHFNLTEGKAISPVFIAKYGENLLPLPQLLRKAMLRQLDRQAVEAEFLAQVARFKEGVDAAPDFIDGHQHVHQFPVIRDVWMSAYEKAFKHMQKPYVRSVLPAINAMDFLTNFKKIIIYCLGAKALKSLLHTHEIPHNTSFAGIYSFNQAAQYRDLFIGFLKASENGGLIMCHPGLLSENSADPIAKARYAEYQYFFGDHFLYDCHQQEVTLGRFYS
jgi:predicted glycoside hydrolase/deacetylase ChbG (UPF0249 family)